MKKILFPLMVIMLLPATYSCSSLQKLGYTLNQKDAENALRQLLQIGTKEGGYLNAFSKENMLSAVFPEPVAKALKTLQQLGLSNEIDRFTTTLSTAAEQTAEKSVPIFLDGIDRMQFKDAIAVIKNGGTAATDYLRSSVGDSLRRAVTPVMQQALDEYKLTKQWNDIIKPVKALTGDKLNVNLSSLMAGIVTEVMFQKIAAKEQQIRTDASARTTSLLKKVFSQNRN
ncbi:MAG TPA: DUF4197 domain-containing protein [Chitinophagaceae bacterium]